MFCMLSKAFILPKQSLPEDQLFCKIMCFAMHPYYPMVRTEDHIDVKCKYQVFNSNKKLTKYLGSIVYQYKLHDKEKSQFCGTYRPIFNQKRYPTICSHMQGVGWDRGGDGGGVGMGVGWGCGGGGGGGRLAQCSKHHTDNYQQIQKHPCSIYQLGA